ncbi:unnamed protein product [Rotaria sp. Silwood1]|nr:unnamed protein product [Rotaria sp. Silwood1]
MPPKREGDGSYKRIESRDNQVKINKHLADFRVCAIQLRRSRKFMLEATNAILFNRLLNDFTQILAAYSQTTAKIFVPQSIQRIKDTGKVALVKRVDLEISEARINNTLMEIVFNVENAIRLTIKERNTATQTIKIIFNDSENRNAFVQTGLQIEDVVVDLISTHTRTHILQLAH